MTQFNIADYDYRAVLAGHKIPIMLLQGEFDREINAKLASTLRVLQQNPEFKLVEVAGAGHFLNMEKPERFNQELLDFLRQQSYERPEVIKETGDHINHKLSYRD